MIPDLNGSRIPVGYHPQLRQRDLMNATEHMHLPALEGIVAVVDNC